MSVVDVRREGIERCEEKIARYEKYLEAAKQELARRQNSLQKEIERIENPPVRKEKSPLMRMDTILRLTPEKIATHQYIDKIQRNAEYFLEHALSIKEKVDNEDEKAKLEDRIQKLRNVLNEIEKVKQNKSQHSDPSSEHNSKESDE